MPPPHFRYQKISMHDKISMEKIYRLRYQVYAHECGFINPKDYPQNLEQDAHDPQAIHFAAINNHDDIIGYVRMILPGSKKLPIAHHYTHIHEEHQEYQQHEFAELSRLVISQKVRRRQSDGQYLFPDSFDSTQKNICAREHRPLSLGLYKEVYNEANRLGIRHLYTLMEKSLWLLLHLQGFRFQCIGKSVNVYGPVNPYRGALESLKEGFQKNCTTLSYLNPKLPPKDYASNPSSIHATRLISKALSL